ncbi:MAG TPA: hypothetical protein VN893_18965 [Bryobacteraceae bacterium]|nr:hypothetical protein [Bryobacteraceae bacterium]
MGRARSGRNLGGAEEAAIRSSAVAAANDEGYAVDPAQVEIHRP